MQIIKRNGQVAEFDPDKIYQAIFKMLKWNVQPLT